LTEETIREDVDENQYQVQGWDFPAPVQANDLPADHALFVPEVFDVQ
jgi:hypothetical protein